MLPDFLPALTSTEIKAKFWFNLDHTKVYPTWWVPAIPLVLQVFSWLAVASHVSHRLFTCRASTLDSPSQLLPLLPSGRTARRISPEVTNIAPFGAFVDARACGQIQRFGKEKHLGGWSLLFGGYPFLGGVSHLCVRLKTVPF